MQWHCLWFPWTAIFHLEAGFRFLSRGVITIADGTTIKVWQLSVGTYQATTRGPGLLTPWKDLEALQQIKFKDKHLSRVSGYGLVTLDSVYYFPSDKMCSLAVYVPVVRAYIMTPGIWGLFNRKHLSLPYYPLSITLLGFFTLSGVGRPPINHP